MKRILLSAALLMAVGVFMVFELGVSTPSQSISIGKYYIEVDNAFGLTQGADFKIAGIPAGKITELSLPPGCVHGGGNQTCYALVTVNVTQRGWGQFHSDAFCQTRPQSLIGEYFIECQPGTHGRLLPPGSHIPRRNTQSTIPVDLVNSISQLPYRQRFTLIINELGAAVAGRSNDLQVALRRAVPALTQLDNLLNLLANDSRTLQQLTTDSNTVISALADNSVQVQHFIDAANKLSVTSATQAPNIAATWRDLPPFLEQLRPTMAKLAADADANIPVFRNLIAVHTDLQRLFTNLGPCSQPHPDNACGFSDASRPALQALGQASIPGKSAVQAATPTVAHLNTLTGPSGCLQHDLSVGQHAPSQFNPVHGFTTICLPELVQNLAIFLSDIDNRNRAVEPDSRSPGGKGFTGMEALLWYLFVQPLSINTYTQFGHILAVDATIDTRCSPYATPQSIANGLSQYGPSYRQCYAWYGPNQPGINELDPSRPSACVPDPGGTMPGQPGPNGPPAPCKLQPAPGKSLDTQSADTQSTGGGGSPGGGGASASTTPGSGLLSSIARTAPTPSSGGANATRGSSPSASADAPGSGGTSGSSAGTSGSSGGSSGQSQALLNYLLAP
jgi:virulence factor Mce-like protein